MKPITPDDVKKQYSLDDKLVEIINNLIVKYWNGSSSRVKREDIVIEAKKLNLEVPTNIGSEYEKYNWKVKFESPYYDEQFDSYYEFTPKQRIQIS